MVGPFMTLEALLETTKRSQFAHSTAGRVLLILAMVGVSIALAVIGSNAAKKKTPAKQPTQTELKTKNYRPGIQRRSMANGRRNRTQRAAVNSPVLQGQGVELSEGERVVPGEFNGDLSSMPRLPTLPK